MESKILKFFHHVEYVNEIHLLTCRRNNIRFNFWSGFNAYVGYLLLEHAHANPVLVTFCRLLIKTMTDRQTDLVDEESIVEANNHVVECASKLF